MRECKSGDPRAVARRMEALAGIPLLSLSAQAAKDALHVANPVIQAQIAARLAQLGLALPFICPPEERLGEDDE